MGLVINTNVPALNTARILRRSTLALNKSLERLASGLRINSAKDDAAGLAIAESFRSQVLGLRVAARNSQDGISLVQTAEGALSEVTNILQRIRELAVQAANGTNTVQNRADLDLEVQQLKLQITDIARRTTFNGVLILNGTVPGNKIILQTGVKATETTDIDFTNANVLLTGPLALSTTGVDGADATKANAAIVAVDLALIIVNSQRATFGAAQNRLEFTIKVLEIQAENNAAAESAIRDVDIAQETIIFTRNQILVSAGTSILAQANLVPQTALQLLG
ncbi:MAG: flagellin FliC [Candidatus Hydrogenedentes bacterium]|nr:flagellin FliC [Candidatus Hydrogenedentota bacterium]